ncbi:MAG: glucosaminidase domain-containing protein [Bacteroidales bacterium]|nr:glucosaminidase domain-containing protein [Bacteroidales bacterium]MCF8398149.1 glucosaminidase domain-containing protein [Bacteroidales bacterium]
MIHTILLAVLFASISINPETPDLKENQKNFILEFTPKIFEANQSIHKLRAKVMEIRSGFLKDASISDHDEIYISKLSKAYGLNSFKLDDEKDHELLLKELNELLERIDIIPPRLIMAQAIIESGWGKSYFAKEANNYFGVHCYSKGCGIPPKGASDAGFEVKKYPNLEDGIADYMQILNSYSAYDHFRKTRANMREKSETLDPVVLAGSLTRYSQKGDAYVKLIRQIIHEFLPGDLEKLVDSLQ